MEEKKALLEIIENCMRELEYDYFYSVTELTIERNQTIETLRSLCENTEIKIGNATPTLKTS